MKKLAGLVLLACGLFVYPCLSFAENISADIIITPSAYTGFFGGLAGGDGNPGPNSIDWGIGNSVPFGSMTDDMVFSTSTGDFMTGSNWKERMRITKDGNVGIGTANPEAKLDVDGAIKLPGPPNSGQTLLIYNDPGDATDIDGFRILFNEDFFGRHNDALVFEKTDSNQSIPDSGDSGIAFVNTGLAGEKTALVIKGDGNVGIGTTEPDAKLHVYQPGNPNPYPQILIETQGDGAIRFKSSQSSEQIIEFMNSDTGNDSWMVGMDDNGLFSIDYDTAGEIDTAMVTVDQSGNVGIGTTSPSVKLEVNGKVRADEFLTGDIVFHKDDKPVWRMYEDEKGLYVQSLTTDKKYALVLDEMADGVAIDKIQQLQEKNNALEARLAKLESLIKALQ